MKYIILYISKDIRGVIMKKILLMIILASALVGCQQKKAQITLNEAKEIALQEVAGEVKSISEQNDDGRIYFDVDILKDGVMHDIDVDGSGRITSHKQDTILTTTVPDSSNNPTPTATTVVETAPAETVAPTAAVVETTPAPTAAVKLITAEEAKKIALKKVGGGTVSSCEFDIDDGIQHYDIEIYRNMREYDISVDAVSGAIIEYDFD